MSRIKRQYENSRQFSRSFDNPQEWDESWLAGEYCCDVLYPHRKDEHDRCVAQAKKIAEEFEMQSYQECSEIEDIDIPW